MISNIWYVGSAVQPRSQVLSPTRPGNEVGPSFATIRMIYFTTAATVREKSGKKENFSRSGKSQGIKKKIRENL